MHQSSASRPLSRLCSRRSAGHGVSWRILRLSIGFIFGLVSLYAGSAAADPSEDVSLDILLLAALEQPGLSADEIIEAKRQARRSGALPRLTLRTRRIWRDAQRAEELAQGPRTRVDIDDNVLLEAQIQFDLGRMVYGADSIAWAREAREREHRRALRAREIVQLYYERRRALFELSTMRVRDPEQELRVVEIEALMDALTGGALSRARYRRPARRAEAEVRGIHPSGGRSKNESAIAQIHTLGRGAMAARASEEGIEERLTLSQEETVDENTDEAERGRREEEGAGD